MFCMPKPICLRLFWHWARAAASRTFCTAGSSKPMRMAMMAITTSNSISVKPSNLLLLVNANLNMRPSLSKREEQGWKNTGRCLKVGQDPILADGSCLQVREDGSQAGASRSSDAYEKLILFIIAQLLFVKEKKSISGSTKEHSGQKTWGAAKTMPRY